MGSISKLSQCFLKIPKDSESLMSLLSNECKTKENEHFPKKLGPIRRERVYSFLTLLFRQLPQNGNTKKNTLICFIILCEVCDCMASPISPLTGQKYIKSVQ